MRNNPIVRRFLRLIAIAGNIVFFLWILRNGIDEGFEGTPVQAASYIGLLLLLSLNVFLFLLPRKE